MQRIDESKSYTLIVNEHHYKKFTDYHLLEKAIDRIKDEHIEIKIIETITNTYIIK